MDFTPSVNKSPSKSAVAFIIYVPSTMSTGVFEHGGVFSAYDGQHGYVFNIVDGKSEWFYFDFLSFFLLHSVQGKKNHFSVFHGEQTRGEGDGPI